MLLASPDLISNPLCLLLQHKQQTRLLRALAAEALVREVSREAPAVPEVLAAEAPDSSVLVLSMIRKFLQSAE
jgi:hypothetical protein